jgi:small-conductance mechanosensitive channel
MGYMIIDTAARWASGLAAHSGSKELFWSLGLMGCASLAARIQFKRIKEKEDATLEQKRQARATFRNALIFATLGMLGFVWGGEIRSLILSLAAILAAIMIVSKEVISCFYGAFVFAISKPAKIGDSIEIGGHKGELLDHNWFSLSIMELSDTHFYSGRLVKIPNSILLTSPVANLSQGGAYRFATLTLHARHEHAARALELATECANAVCASWTSDAKEHMKAIQSAHLTQTPDVEPKASLVSVDKDSLAISLRFVAPAGQRANIQAEISRKYFLAFESHLKAEKDRDRLASEHAAIKSAMASTAAKP